VKDFWSDYSGVAATWTGRDTVEIVEEYPEDYPKAIRNAAADAETIGLFTAAKPWIDASPLVNGSSRSIRTCFGKLERMPPVPVVGEVTVRSADGGRTLAVGRYMRVTEWATRSDNWRPYVLLEKGVEPAEVLDAKKLLLRFTGTREAAIRDVPLEEYWGGSFELLVPVRTKE
jgi:hypothetical protein